MSRGAGHARITTFDINEKLHRAIGGSCRLILLALVWWNIAGDQQILLILDIAFGQDRQPDAGLRGYECPERRQARFRHAVAIKRNIAIGIDQLLPKATHLQLAQIIGMQILIPLKLPQVGSKSRVVKFRPHGVDDVTDGGTGKVEPISTGCDRFLYRWSCRHLRHCFCELERGWQGRIAFVFENAFIGAAHVGTRIDTGSSLSMSRARCWQFVRREFEQKLPTWPREKRRSERAKARFRAMAIFGTITGVTVNLANTHEPT